MLTGISDGGFDTKQLNIIYYQNINQMILMDILQQSLIHIHCKPLYLKCLDERLRLFSNIYIIVSVSKVLRRSLQERLVFIKLFWSHSPIPSQPTYVPKSGPY